MITCKITDFVPTASTKSACKAHFSVTVNVNDEPLVEINNCVLLFGQKVQTYYIGFPSYKRGNKYDRIAAILSPEVNAEITLAAVRTMGQEM